MLRNLNKSGRFAGSARAADAPPQVPVVEGFAAFQTNVSEGKGHGPERKVESFGEEKFSRGEPGAWSGGARGNAADAAG